MKRKSDTEREERFLEITDSHKQLVAKVCYLYSSPDAPFEDLYQEVLANIWEGMDSFRGEAKMSTWIYRTAINACLTWHRRNDRHSRDRIALEDLVAEPAGTDSTLVEDIRALHALISRLDPLEKALITLWLDEKPYEEIAAIAGISRANVAVRIHRIKDKLSKMASAV
ncbi:MAG: sigma-70 family RNA polymerase sigma factor [Muribaculaceae bacterium]|nr:sigma-70 family RNA polymerase sigma factor [Muribaculaceae bacterium]